MESSKGAYSYTHLQTGQLGYRSLFKLYLNLLFIPNFQILDCLMDEAKTMTLIGYNDNIVNLQVTFLSLL